LNGVILWGRIGDPFGTLEMPWVAEAAGKLAADLEAAEKLTADREAAG
jgi:hypothetical protein